MQQNIYENTNKISQDTQNIYENTKKIGEDIRSLYQTTKRMHQEDGYQLFFDTPFSLLFLAYSALYCHFWPINFYNFTT